MIPKDSDSSHDGDWDDPEELGWGEFEWEKYLTAQDTTVERYIAFYNSLPALPERLDQVARLMDWDSESVNDEADDELDDAEFDSSEDFGEPDPYTVLRNPAFIASSALYLLLGRAWDNFVQSSPQLAPSLAIAFHSSLFRGERQALMGIHSLDLGDYTLSISQMKRAMRDLNTSMSILCGPLFSDEGPFAALRLETMPKLFDLREIILRIIRECREEIARHPRNSEGEDDGEKRSDGA